MLPRLSMNGVDGIQKERTGTRMWSSTSRKALSRCHHSSFPTRRTKVYQHATLRLATNNCLFPPQQQRHSWWPACVRQAVILSLRRNPDLASEMLLFLLFLLFFLLFSFIHPLHSFPGGHMTRRSRFFQASRLSRVPELPFCPGQYAAVALLHVSFTASSAHPP